MTPAPSILAIIKNKNKNKSSFLLPPKQNYEKD